MTPATLGTNEEVIFEKIVNDLTHQNYSVNNNFMTIEEIESIKDILIWHEEQDNLYKAGIGNKSEKQINSEIRGDYIRWIDPKSVREPIQIYLKKIDRLIMYLNQTCYLGIKDAEVHFTVYPEESAYERHLDQFKESDTRKISFIIYLNPNWQKSDGGILRLFIPSDNNEEIIEILPEAGTFVCFLSGELEHEVTKSFRKRYSLTGWMRNMPIGLSFLS